MSKNIEIESKILLSQKLYQQIITSFTKKAQFEQSNYYFDNQQQTLKNCLLYTSPSPRDVEESRMPSSA